VTLFSDFIVALTIFFHIRNIKTKTPMSSGALQKWQLTKRLGTLGLEMIPVTEGSGHFGSGLRMGALGGEE